MVTRLGRLPPEELLLLRLARLDPTLDSATRRVLDGPLDWHRFWSLARRHQVVALCWAAVRGDAELRARVPDDLAANATRVSIATGIRTADRTAEALRVLDALATAGSDPMLVKGIALVHDVYRGQALRTFEDIDVLVGRDDLATAQRVLHELGYRNRSAPTFEETVHRFHDLQYFRPLAGSSQCLELHWDLWDSRLHRSDIEGFWSRARTLRVGEREVRTLSHEDTLLHLAIHRTRAPLRLRFVCDIAELVRARSAVLDWPRLVASASRTRARTALHMALRLASELLDAPVPERVLVATSPGRVKATLLDRTCGVAAMFRVAPEDDVTQQPHLVLRALELDGARAIASAGGRAVERKVAKWRYGRRAAAATGQASGPPQAARGEHRADENGSRTDDDPGPIGGHEGTRREGQVEPLRHPYEPTEDHEEAEHEEGDAHRPIVPVRR